MISAQSGDHSINCCDSDPDKLIGKCSEEEIALARDKQRSKGSSNWDTLCG